jgi:hypothetical protein
VPGEWAYQSSREMWILVTAFSDEEGRAARLDSDPHQWVVYRGGVKFGVSGGDVFIDPPDGEAAYRVVLTGTRKGEELTSVVTLDWSFRSGVPSTGGVDPLPLMAAAYTPRLSAADLAAGKGRIGVAIQHHTKVPVAGRPAVELSYDSGQTWQPATVHGGASDRYVCVEPPAGAAKVSVRTSATDREGNTVTQTTIDAYPLPMG